MPITSDLESNRVQELEILLTRLQPRIVEYVASAEKNGSLGTYHDPADLKKIFTQNDTLFQHGVRNDPDELFRHIDNVLAYSVNTWSPGFLDKLYASNNPVGVVGDVILSVLNTNSHVYTVSPVLSVLENYMGRKYAQLFFHTDTCGGLTFPGGSWSNITALHMARSLRYPETKLEGNKDRKFAVYASQHCHYSIEKAAILLGLGSHALFKVGIHRDGSMDTESLDRVILESAAAGYTPLFINATAGTTVFGLFDNLAAIGEIAKKHRVWFHVDGSWGGNVVFSDKHRGKLAGIDRADSVTSNPHKMLGTPTTCLFLLVPDVRRFQTANSLDAPYLFHGRENDDENLDLADGTMGCGRRADSFKFYLAWLYYGYQGLQERVDHAYRIVDYFVLVISSTTGFDLVVERPQCLQVCFYYHPPNFEGSNYTEVTRYVSRELHRKGKYLVDFLPNPARDGHGEFFRVVFNSPILTDSVVDDLVASIIEVGASFQQ